MQAEFDNMVKEMLGYGVSDEVPEAELTRLTRIYAYSPFIQYLFSLHLKEKNDPRYAASVAKTALYFSNPHWLNHQLRNGKSALIIEGKQLEKNTAETRAPDEFSPAIVNEVLHQDPSLNEESDLSVVAEDTTTRTLDLFILETENEDFSDPDQQTLLEQVENELRAIDNSTTELITAIVSDTDSELDDDSQDPDLDFKDENFETDHQQSAVEFSEAIIEEPGQPESPVNKTEDPENRFNFSEEERQHAVEELETPTEEFIQIPGEPEEKPEHDDQYQLPEEYEPLAEGEPVITGEFDQNPISETESSEQVDQIIYSEANEQPDESDVQAVEEIKDNEGTGSQPDFSQESYVPEIEETTSVKETVVEKLPEPIVSAEDQDESDVDDTEPVAGSDAFSGKPDPEFKMPGLRIESNQPLPDKIDFEPLHTVDYFASQGIKFSVEEDGKDKLSNRLKSFTDWLKSMKKIHPERLSRDMDEKTEMHIKTDAEQSNDKTEILTETMAEILQKQGLIDKALEVYEKLVLLNPSKSDYFAAKISALKAIGI